MNDADLKSLYRRMTRTASPGVDADLVHDALSRSGHADVEGTSLDHVATSAAHADVLRTALELSPDAATLARDVAALRAPRRLAPPARGWLALAAGVGSAAILIAALRPDTAQVPAPVAIEVPATTAGEIFSMSFESGVETPPTEGDELDEAMPIFDGGFDS